MKTKLWFFRKWILLLTMPLLAVAHLPAQSGSKLPGLYITNAVVLPDGYAQMEVRTPSPTNAFAVLSSRDLQTWKYWTALNSSTNRYILKTPSPISDIETVYLRAAPLGQAIHKLDFNFRLLWNGPLSNGTPAMTWSQQIENWQATLHVENCTNLEAAPYVRFTGPPGSGIISESVQDEQVKNNRGYYDSSFLSPASLTPGGVWTVQYGTNFLTFDMPDPRLTNHAVVAVPNFEVSNGFLSAVSWTYRELTTGTIWGAPPAFVKAPQFSIYSGDLSRFGPNDNKVFESPELANNVTNFVFSPSIAWSNTMFVFEHEDTLDNSFTCFYSCWNQYEVYGGDSFSTSEANWGDKGLDPASHGYVFLGSATNTSSFTGAYNVYVVRVPKHNAVKIDTVRGSNGLWYRTYVTGNMSDVQNIGGPPDGLYSLVGPTSRGFYTGGFFVIDATGQGILSLTILTSP